MASGKKELCIAEQSSSVQPAFLHGVLRTLVLLPRPKSSKTTGLSGRLGLNGDESLVGVGLVDWEMSLTCRKFPSVNFFSIQSLSLSLGFLSLTNFSALRVNRFIAWKTTSRELK